MQYGKMTPFPSYPNSGDPDEPVYLGHCLIIETVHSIQYLLALSDCVNALADLGILSHMPYGNLLPCCAHHWQDDRGRYDK